MVFWTVLGVGKAAVGLAGAARFVVGIFGAATTTAAAPAAAATMLDMSPPITPPVLRKTPNGSPVTTPEHSPATQLRLGKWVDGHKDNAKVKLGESAYKVSPFSHARLSI